MNTQLQEKWKPHIGHKHGVSNPAGLEAVDDLGRDVGVVQKAGRNIDHAPRRSGAHPIHSHSAHSSVTSLGAHTLRLVDLSLSNHTVRVLME